MREQEHRDRPSAHDPVPAPAHPHLRREPLPWHRPKPAEEDPDAPRRLQAILDSPTYRQADCDVALLGQDETRGVRLQLDYAQEQLARFGGHRELAAKVRSLYPLGFSAEEENGICGRLRDLG